MRGPLWHVVNTASAATGGFPGEWSSGCSIEPPNSCDVPFEFSRTLRLQDRFLFFLQAAPVALFLKLAICMLMWCRAFFFHWFVRVCMADTPRFTWRIASNKPAVAHDHEHRWERYHKRASNGSLCLKQSPCAPTYVCYWCGCCCYILLLFENIWLHVHWQRCFIAWHSAVGVFENRKVSLWKQRWRRPMGIIANVFCPAGVKLSRLYESSPVQSNPIQSISTAIIIMSNCHDIVVHRTSSRCVCVLAWVFFFFVCMRSLYVCMNDLYVGVRHKVSTQWTDSCLVDAQTESLLVLGANPTCGLVVVCFFSRIVSFSFF